MDRSREYSLHMSQKSRGRQRHHEPNMSVKSGTYQIHLSIPRSMVPGNISIQAANSRHHSTSPVQQSPMSPVETNSVHAAQRSYTRPSIFNVSLPVENTSLKEQVSSQNFTPLSIKTGNSLNLEEIQNGDLVTPRSDQNGNTSTPRSPDFDSCVYTPRSQNGEPFQNSYSVRHRVVKNSVERSKSFTAKHYIQKSGRTRTPDMTPNGTFPRSLSPPPVTTAKSFTNGSQTSKTHVAMATPRVKDDSLTARSVLDTSMTSQSSFRANMYETYRDLCLQKRQVLRPYIFRTQLYKVCEMLFKDPDFPATDESLFGQGKSPIGHVEWKRPTHLCKKPTFLSNDLTSFSVLPGKLGRIWLMGAFSCLISTPSLIKHCIPEGQGFEEKYVGIFRFRFWRFGQWVDVVIDDRLPTVNNEVLGIRSTDPSEFWPALFEKAYAKFNGGYENCRGGILGSSLQDITGGVTMVTNIQESPELTKKVLDVGLDKATLMGVSVKGSQNGKPIPHLNGLTPGQVYSVTGYAELPVISGTLVLVRLRDFLGRTNWNGAWCEGSKYWEALSEDVRTQVRNRKMENGEFWMSFVDFIRVFNLLEVCFLTPESWKLEPKIQHRKAWRSAQAVRQWRAGYNAGGGHKSPLVSYNCQFYLELSQPSCVVVSLTQRYRSTVKRGLLPTGSLVYKAPPSLKTRLGYSEFNKLQLLSSTEFHHNRENTGFCVLPAGSYVVLPVTANSEMEGKFLLRIFTEGDSIVKELDEDDNIIPYKYDRKLHATSLIAFRRKFLYAINQDDELDAQGLQSILEYKQNEILNLWCCNHGDEDGFKFKPLRLSLETCKSAIAIADKDLNGRLNYDEFNHLLHLLMHWQEIFHKLSNGSVNCETYTLRTALKMAGFTVSNKTLEALIIRFANKGTITLELYVNALVKLSVAHQRRLSIQHETGQKNSGFLQELLRTAIYS